VNAIGSSGHGAAQHAEAITKYGVPALQKAFDIEEKSMLEYIEKKLRAGAKSVGIKTN
jgi:hypothetical protein